MLMSAAESMMKVTVFSFSSLPLIDEIMPPIRYSMTITMIR